MRSENSTKKTNFYLAILSHLHHTTNLSKIRKELNLSKENLNYYLRELRKNGYIQKKSRGYYEVTERSENITNHSNFLTKDTIRGHAFVWEVKIPKIPNWENRISVLDSKKIHYVLVGAKLNTPRIMILGRKVWLCNNHIRIYDKKGSSYYGINAIESRKYAFNELSLILDVLERKLGYSMNRLDITWKKEHFALIKNDLAIECNKKGEIIRVKDKFGEWLLIDDSLEQGGELETVGKKSLVNNVPLQKWWNEQKETKFKVTPSFLLESISGLVQTQQMNADNIIKHQKVLDEMLITLKKIQEKL